MTDTQPPQITEAFGLFRRWLLFGASNPEYRLQLLSNEVENFRSLFGKTVQLHDWAGEAALADLGEYDLARAIRVLELPTRFPSIVYQLQLRQLFDAADHGILTPLALYPDAKKFEQLFHKQNRHGGLRLLRGEYVARNPKTHKQLRADFERSTKNRFYTSNDSLKNMKRLLNDADRMREQLFYGHLRVLLSETEYTEAKDLTLDLLQSLYPDIWEQGAKLATAHLRETQPVTFKYGTLIQQKNTTRVK